MQEDFSKHRNEFRKGSQLRKFNEDPTYLSWFFMFDYISHESPLFNGAANTYLENVVGGDYGKALSTRLSSFIKLFQRINKEMPWFWQSLAGIEVAMQYQNLEEPFWGANKPKLEIECLEENVDLTAIALMDLYKRAIFDFNRWVEIVPKNLRHFRMYVIVSEIRQFQQDIAARNTDSRGRIGDHNPKGQGSYASPDDTPLNTEMSLAAKPFVKLQFDFCEFSIDDISAMFADLGRNPELKKPKIGIFWESAKQVGQNFNVSEDVSTEGLAVPGKIPDYQTGPFDPKQAVQDIANKKAQEVKDAFDAKKKGIQNALNPQSNSEIGNVFGGPGLLGGAAETFAGGLADSIAGRLLLGNVHGLGGIGSIQDAIQAGSINAVANLAGQLFGQRSRPGSGDLSPGNIYPKDNFALDSSPDGNITPKKVYDPIAPDRDDPINDNVHE